LRIKEQETRLALQEHEEEEEEDYYYYYYYYYYYCTYQRTCEDVLFVNIITGDK